MESAGYFKRVFRPRSMSLSKTVPVPIAIDVSRSETTIWLPTPCCWSHVVALEDGVRICERCADQVYSSAYKRSDRDWVRTQYYFTKQCREEVIARLLERFKVPNSPVPALEDFLMAEDVAVKLGREVRKTRREYDWSRTLVLLARERAEKDSH